MYEDFDPADLHPEDEVKVKKPVINEMELPIPFGKVVNLEYLTKRGWSLGKVDVMVRTNALIYLPGKNAYQVNKHEIY